MSLRKLKNSKMLIAFLPLILLVSCGGVSVGLPSTAFSSVKIGSKISKEDPIKVSFLSRLDGSTIIGNVTVFADGEVVEILVDLEDNGYTLVVSPMKEWPTGSRLALTIRGGKNGVWFARGFPIETVNLYYFVESEG